MGQTNFVSPTFSPRISVSSSPALKGCGGTFGQDLSRSVLIFGGLFITAAAVCSTLDMARPTGLAMDDVRVDDYAVGPVGFDPYALDCEKERPANGFSLAAVHQCRVSGKVSGKISSLDNGRPSAH